MVEGVVFARDDLFILKGDEICKGGAVGREEPVNLLDAGISGLLIAVTHLHGRLEDSVMLLCGKLVDTVQA